MSATDWCKAIATWIVGTIAIVWLASIAARADTPSKPFEIQIQSNVAVPCTMALDDPKLALAWIQLVAGSITPKQMSDIVHMLHPEPEAEQGVKNMDAAIKACIVGDDA
jgi:hypothetical protein